MIKGLYIEDDSDNIDSYTAIFRTQDIELIPVEQFPESPKGFWEIVIANNVDFIIIDNHLHKKKVAYKGLEILSEIRKVDSEIYVLYLTSKGFSPDDDYLSDFDQEIDKNDFSQEFPKIVQRIKRAASRELAYKLEREIETVQKEQEKYYDQRLEYLKTILG